MTFSPEINYRKRNLREEKSRVQALKAETEGLQILENHFKMVKHLGGLGKEIQDDMNFRDFKALGDVGMMIAREKYGNEEPLYLTDIFYRRLQGYGDYEGLQSEGLVFGIRLQKKDETKFLLHMDDKHGERNFEVTHEVAPMKGWRKFGKKALTTSIPIERYDDDVERGLAIVGLPQVRSDIKGFEVYKGQVDKSGESGFDMVVAKVADLDLLSAFNKWLDSFNEIKDDKTVEQIKAYMDEVAYGLLEVRLNSILDALEYYEGKRYGLNWSQYSSNAVKLAEKKLKPKASGWTGHTGGNGGGGGSSGPKPVGPTATEDLDGQDLAASGNES